MKTRITWSGRRSHADGSASFWWGAGLVRAEHVPKHATSLHGVGVAVWPNHLAPRMLANAVLEVSNFGIVICRYPAVALPISGAIYTFPPFNLPAEVALVIQVRGVRDAEEADPTFAIAALLEDGT